MSEALKELSTNEPDIFVSVVDTLLRYANNVLENPSDGNHRRIFINSPEITAMLSVKGAIDCLFSLGFEEGGEYFVYPANKDLSPLRLFRDQLHRAKNKVTEVLTKPSKPVRRSVGTPFVKEPDVLGFVDQKQYPRNIHELEVNFYSKILAYGQEVLLLEDPHTHEAARQCMPLPELTQRAEKMLHHLSSSQNESKPQFNLPKPDLRDCLLIELLKWFKENFFHWVDKPECDNCKGTTEAIGALSPLAEESVWGVSRVEGYRCNVCAKQVRFPRHNHPLKLLETRRGRCGEWAKCFTLCCRAVNFEARLVYDWTDHVWTEVYSDSQRRWIHADPCENICDQPLIYESGWNKKLAYIIAFSQDEVVDVTWRYSSCHAEVLLRRLLCREAWLLDSLYKFNALRQQKWPSSRKLLFLERMATELVEFLCPRTASSSEQTGRTSGSLSWRLSRAEVTPEDQIKPYIFKLCQSELYSKLFHIKYSSAFDKYVHESNGNQEIKSWSSLVYQCQNVVLKIENDWKMSYLARTEDSTTASISWQFDFSSCDLTIDNIELSYKSTTFEDGLVIWKLCSEDKCIMLPAGGIYKSNSAMKGCKKITLQANLSRGKGNCAWQHTQLFRQSLTDGDYPFEVKIVLI